MKILTPTALRCQAWIRPSALLLLTWMGGSACGSRPPEGQEEVPVTGRARQAVSEQQVVGVLGPDAKWPEAAQNLAPGLRPPGLTPPGLRPPGLAPESPRPPATDIQGAKVPAEGMGKSAVVLESNVLRGTAQLTNTNPAILNLLATSPWYNDAYAWATSTSPRGFSTSAATVKVLSPTQTSFEMLVEAGAGGPEGVTYEVYARRDVTHFPALSGVKVRPRSVQPEPTDVSLNMCMGVLQFQIGTDDTCEERSSTFVSGWSDYISTYALPEQTYTAFVPGGSSGTTPFWYVFRGKDRDGKDTDLIAKRDVTWSAGCDEVARYCIPVDGAYVAAPDGDFTGPFEVIGEPLTAPGYVYAHHVSYPIALGVELNQDKPESDPGSWWKLLRASEGNWWMLGQGYVRTGRDFTFLRAPYLYDGTQFGSVPVVVDQMTPVTRTVGTDTRHAFSMHPAYFYGSILLADPSMQGQTGAWSTLQSLYFEADQDSNGDGIPNYTTIGDYGSFLNAVGESYAFSRTAFPGNFSLATGELRSTYRQVLPNSFDLPVSWAQEYMNLRFWSEAGTPGSYTRPGLYDPLRYRYGSLSHAQATGNWSSLAPEAQKNVDHEYCYNEVRLRYVPSFGQLFNPSAHVSGTFTGTDWLGRPANYNVGGWFSGTPAVLGGDYLGDGVLYKQSEGLVSMALPQGIYTITPAAYMVSDTDSVSYSTFNPVRDVTLGCGQDLEIVPPLAVSVSAPACASGPTQTLSGTVVSRPALVDRIWYRLNGGAEITLCNNCGMDPTFSFSVPLQACGNDITVFAFSAGMVAPATASLHLTWDDPADGPTCGDSACSNRPPQTRCRDITVHTGEACSGCGSVNDGSYDPDTGDSISCVQTPDCPYSTGSQRVTLTCTDTHGRSTSCEATVKVKDESPPTLVCPSELPVLECLDGGAPLTYATSASDNCGAVSTLCYPGSGATFPPGTTQAQCTATDTSGNQTRCTFPVTVEDNEPPTLTCPPSVTAECNDGHGNASLPDAPVTASDTCQPPDIDGPRSFPVGSTTTVTYTAHDAGGHQASCSTTLSAVDTLPPVLTPYGDSPLSLVCGQPYVEPGVKARDACHGSLSSQVVTSGHVDPWTPGSYVINYAVSDPEGHPATLSRQVTVLGRSSTPGPASGWSGAASTPALLQLHSATRLADGQILAVGGWWPSKGQVYNPSSNTWRLTSDMTHASSGQTRMHTPVTLLPNGRVLVAGGLSDSHDASAELYDPATDTWSATASMATGRVHHTATRLQTDQVLVTGGTQTVAQAELYNPSTNTWQPAGTPSAVRSQHTATLLPNGRVLVVGGRDPAWTPLNTAEVFDPVTHTWTSMAPMAWARKEHTATLLPTGRVLVTGGAAGVGASTAELYDPATNTWSSIGNMHSPRRQHTATLLPSGRVLVTGGYDALTGILTTAEVYDPCNGSWTSVASMSKPRDQHTATLLSNGRVLILAGVSPCTAGEFDSSGGCPKQYSVEVFNPDGL